MNKNFKRIITFALAVACITFGFYGCNDADSSNSSAESSESSTTVAESSTTSVEETENTDETDDAIEDELAVEDREETLGSLIHPIKKGQEIIFISHMKDSDDILKLRAKVLKLGGVEDDDLTPLEGKEDYAFDLIHADPSEYKYYLNGKLCKMEIELEALDIAEPLVFNPIKCINSTTTEEDEEYFTMGMGSELQNLESTFVQPDNITINEGETKTFTVYFFKGEDDYIFLTLPSENNLCIYYKTEDPEYYDSGY